MAKSFVSKRTPQAEAMMEDTTEHLRAYVRGVEEEYGFHSREASEARIILAAHYHAAEVHQEVEPLLIGYVGGEKGKEGTNPMWAFWALSLLFEAYVNLNRISEAMLISKEGTAIAKKTDASAPDPLLEALLQRATALESQGETKSRQRAFVAALLTLCWFVSHGFDRSRADAHVLDRLRGLCASYGIAGEEWEWTVKHAHLTRYDFVGLLSKVLPNMCLVPTPVQTMVRRRPPDH